MKPFDDQAHVVIADILDKAELRIANELGVIEAEASDYLCIDYIKTSARFIDYATQYLESDEVKAADIFLHRHATGTRKRQLPRAKMACARQLVAHTARYFPDYEAALRQSALCMIHTAPSLDAIDRSGLLAMASATLPGFRTDLRRERRRRGALSDRTIVRDDTLQRRLAPAFQQLMRS